MVRFRTAACLALALLTGSVVTEAQEIEPGKTAGWFELNSFHPASTPDDGYQLERAQVLRSLQPSLAAVVQIDDDPLTWQREEDGSFTETEVEVERLLVVHFTAAIGLFEYAQLGAQLPLYLDKGRTASTGGVGDARVVPKGAYRFPVGENEMGVALTLPVSFPSGESTSFTGEGQVAFEPRLVLDLVVGRLRLIGNGGFLIKEGETRHGLRRGKEAFGGLGAQFEAFESFLLQAEFTMATQGSDIFGRASTPAELLGGMIYTFPGGISISAAAGAGVTPGVGAPDFRFIAGIGVVPLPFGEARAKAEAAARAEAEANRDDDGDGYRNADDFCPQEPEDFDDYSDDDGCEDTDNDDDGVRDVDDKCPMDPENRNGVDDWDGCPENDSDGDGLPDDRDNCPDVEEDMNGVKDDDGCPDGDGDGDGVVDADDSCIALPESEREDAVRDGCPDTYSVEGGLISFKRKPGFLQGKAELDGNAVQVFTDLAEGIKQNPQWLQLGIVAHTSGKGNKAKNRRLSERRANAVMRFLIAAGVKAERLVAEGAGDSAPLGKADTAEGRAMNERVEVVIIKKGGSQ
jgi:outer membrane protein OmpA-like peptidoglycan-associated protein